jgi:hypothetical protein
MWSDSYCFPILTKTGMCWQILHRLFQLLRVHAHSFSGSGGVTCEQSDFIKQKIIFIKLKLRMHLKWGL